MAFRGRPYAFDSPDEAVAGMVRRLDASGAARGSVECALGEALRRILAEPVVADRDSPPFDHSAMDGYAVRAADLSAGGGAMELPVAGESVIGAPPPAMPESAGAVRIATGAPLPGGRRPADAILKREEVSEIEGAGGVVRISVSREVCAGVVAGAHIRRRGENGRAGACIAERGSVVTGATLGALATVGCSRPRVFAPLRVAIVTTGDEVVGVGEAPSAYQIRNANGESLAAALGRHARIRVVSRVHARDDAEGVGRALGEALGAAEAVVMSGGVSMGHRDPVLAAVERAGGEVVFHGLPQRPGKPMLGAVVTGAGGAAPVFGLPGNPVSALVTCTRIVAPVLAQLAGAARVAARPVIRVEGSDAQRVEMWWHRLVRLTGPGRGELVESRGSGDMVSAAMSDGFVEVPPGSAVGGSALCYWGWSA